MLVNNLKDLLGIINVAITYFNWDELRVAANGDPTAIIILTFGLTKSYNMLSGGYMMKKLNISRIPQVLFRKEFLRVKNNKISIQFTTKEKQSYFTYDKFLFARIGVKEKVIYLRALSMRAFDDNSTYIPREFLNITQNPFLKITNDKINFIFESPQGES